MSLTSPLGLMRHLRKPDLRMEVIPWLNVLLVGLAIYLLGSSYVWAPGLVVSNTPAGNLPNRLNLPTLPAQPGVVSLVGHPDATLVILPQVNNAPLFVLNDGRHTEDNLEPALAKLRKSLPMAKPVLLLKSNKDVSVTTILKVCAMAQDAGFGSELLAFVPSGYATPGPAATDAAASAKSP